MINILVNKSSPRFRYICEVIFKHILRTEYQIIEESSKDLINAGNNKNMHINYSQGNNKPGIRIPDKGLLFSDKITEIEPDVKKEKFLKIFNFENEELDIDFDLFSATFYLITEYEKYFKQVYDKHNRYMESAYYVHTEGLYKFPLVNTYAEYLWQILVNRYSGLKREKSSFSYEITIDVDFPWAYLNKGFYTYAGIVKDLVMLNANALSQRISAIKSNKDPYYSFDYIFRMCPPENTIFFFLGEGNSRFDNKYSFGNQSYSELIVDISDRGYKCGLHPSYSSCYDEDILVREKDRLENVLSIRIIHSRQHFLRYKLPVTFRNLVKVGIKHDFTSSLINDIGFKNCAATSFPWFDLEENRMTDLIIHPTMVMDVSLKNYLKLDKEEALQRTFGMIDKTAEVSGKFVLLWHNNSLSEIQGWEGWTKVFEEIINYLKTK